MEQFELQQWTALCVTNLKNQNIGTNTNISILLLAPSHIALSHYSLSLSIDYSYNNVIAICKASKIKEKIFNQFYNKPVRFNTHYACSRQTSCNKSLGRSNKNKMKAEIADPWPSCVDTANNLEAGENCFEDSFVGQSSDPDRLPDSDEYLARLYSRLKAVKGGTSKTDLINSLSDIKADCLARLLTEGKNFETEEERELAANPLIRHIVPHLQALNSNELVHLLKADVLQKVTQEQQQIENEDTDSDSTNTSDKDIQKQDSNGL